MLSQPLCIHRTGDEKFALRGGAQGKDLIFESAQLYVAFH